jgi:hypothetical protein
MTRFFNTVRHSRVCWYGAPSLTRGRVCLLQLLLSSPAQSVSGPSPSGLMITIYCLRFWDSPNLEHKVPVFITPRNVMARLCPQALGYVTHLSKITPLYTLGTNRTESSTAKCSYIVWWRRYPLGPHRKHGSTVSCAIVYALISFLMQ